MVLDISKFTTSRLRNYTLSDYKLSCVKKEIKVLDSTYFDLATFIFTDNRDPDAFVDVGTNAINSIKRLRLDFDGNFCYDDFDKRLCYTTESYREWYHNKYETVTRPEDKTNKNGQTYTMYWFDTVHRPCPVITYIPPYDTYVPSESSDYSDYESSYESSYESDVSSVDISSYYDYYSDDAIDTTS